MLSKSTWVLFEKKNFGNPYFCCNWHWQKQEKISSKTLASSPDLLGICIKACGSFIDLQLNGLTAQWVQTWDAPPTPQGGLCFCCSLVEPTTQIIWPTKCYHNITQCFWRVMQGLQMSWVAPWIYRLNAYIVNGVMLTFGHQRKECLPQYFMNMMP